MKKFLSMILTLALVLSAAGCEKKYDPQMKAEPSSDSQSQPESSQAAPVDPTPIMPVPSSEPQEDPEPEPEPDPAPEEDEDDGEEAGDDEDADTEDDEDGDEEDGEDEEGEDEETEGYLPPEVPHGEDIAWLDFKTVTVSELRPLLDQVLARAEYFCQYGLGGRFTEGGPDRRAEVSRKATFRGEENWVYYPFTNLPYHTLDELEEDVLTTFSWSTISADLLYLFEIMIDDGERLYYADGYAGLDKTRGWDTSDMVIKSATASRLTLTMPTSWNGYDFEADLTLQLQDGYLVLEGNYFAVSDEEMSKRHHAV